MRVARRRRDEDTGYNYMARDKKLPREALKELYERAGISEAKLSRELGYGSPAGLNRYTRESQQGDKPIPYKIIQRLIPFLRGAGNPPIMLEEILAVSDYQNIPKPVVKAFEAAVVNDGDGLLVVKYRIEAGVFLRLGTKTYGASRIGVTGDYPASVQWVAVDVDQPGVQWQCVDDEIFSTETLVSRQVIVGVPAGVGVNDVVEIRRGKVSAIRNGSPVVYADDGDLLEGRILGVVVGKYERL